jgi:hypothetical protein
LADLDDRYLAAPFDPELMFRVTGREPSSVGNSDVDDGTGIRLVKRLTIRDVAGGIAVLTWPAELKNQATFLYANDRAERLLTAATAGGWETVPRPHLSYFNAPARQRFYMTPRLSAREYVTQWTHGDLSKVGGAPFDQIVALWPWLLDRGYASESDRADFDAYLERLAKSNRSGHLRPGLRLKREWPKAEADEMRLSGRLESVLRDSFDRLLLAVGDPTLPAIA